METEGIVKRCQSGDREAFGIIYRTYLMTMHEVVSHYVHNTDAVWDILHDGFIIAFQSINTLKSPSKIKSWLTTIMKNLALQYLKEESGHLSASLPDVSNIYDEDDSPRTSELTWDELAAIIDRLPAGYGKVFRLAVLEELSHKEIGALLGIAPHSSSSQLSHAKAMLRRMITRYRIETGVLSILIGIVWLLLQGVFRQREESPSAPTISMRSDDKTSVLPDSLINGGMGRDTMLPKSTIVDKIVHPQKHELIADGTIPNDSTPTVEKDSATHDTLRIIPNSIDYDEFTARQELPQATSKEAPDWSMSLAYVGNSPEYHEICRYRISDPNLPDAEGPDDEMEVTEKTHHNVPLVIGLSVNKAFTSRWSIETGLRYTFLRSDFLLESKTMNRKTVQQLHYLGIPLKFNYRIVTYKGPSLYVHGGGILDIPIGGRQYIREYGPECGGGKNRTQRIHAPLQGSAEGGIGLQYQFTPSFSFYAEPSFRYYFSPESDIRTIRQEKPFEFSIPIGLRVTW